MEKFVILVVEDEALIRISAAQLLEDAGYAVVQAWNADVALQILKNRNDIRAVFTDIKMPGSLDGLKLARAIRDRWPPIHLVVASGMEAPGDADFPRFARFIRKPYSPKHLLKALHELLEPDPAPHSATVIQNFGRMA